MTGATSSPTIFAAAITGSDRHEVQLRTAVAFATRDAQELFFELALDDVRRARSTTLHRRNRQPPGADGLLLALVK